MAGFQHTGFQHLGFAVKYLLFSMHLDWFYGPISVEACCLSLVSLVCPITPGFCEYVNANLKASQISNATACIVNALAMFVSLVGVQKMPIGLFRAQ